jgi:putative transposase
MPHKHVRKTFVEGGYYHAYNRGVDKRVIYKDGQDYSTFLNLLKLYLSPSKKNIFLDNKSISHYSVKRPRKIQNLSKEVKLLAYCLMPNHYHLLLKQKSKDGMTKLLRRVGTTYAMYFNKRNERVGHLSR